MILRYFIKMIFIIMIINFNFLLSNNLIEVNKMNKNIRFGTWMRYSNKTEVDWINFFKKYKKAGITDYFVQGNPTELIDLINLTKKLEINIHAWVWTLNRPNDKEAMKNKDWY